MAFNLEGESGVSLKNFRKDIVIDLFNLQGTKFMSFLVYRCWVSEYQPLTNLDANNNRVSAERLVLQHEGWVRDKAVVEPQET